ncbi:hypothetical protein PACTADRAFT_35779 [Pachysolen tannophilus NRRL Y-2460]|uniref:Mediator of RNA polymerase II transcription subunit 20 n=1 Tax=Pachysolen tannophilus NRRL Y-2460 TaxID=669874 RepID=A0A1E4TN16_PACTA|nr:hypothetical protein PACTADRAFT_35779 [Pachysolen tannophilus NRRL Y-2460]
MVTAILLVEKALPNSITSFHDLLSNELPKTSGKWSFELKIYLNNKYSKPDNFNVQQVPNKYLVTLTTSYLPNKTISMINNTKAIMTSSYLSSNDEIDHFEKGCCNSTSLDPFDFIISNKFQNLWNLKQSIRGEGGNSYEITVNNLNINDPNIIQSLPKELIEEVNNTYDTFRIRTANCSLHGSFKGFLIEIEYIDKEEAKDKTSDYNEIQQFHIKINKIKELIKQYKFPNGKLCYNVLNEDKLDYISDLVQQYSEALQF